MQETIKVVTNTDTTATQNVEITPVAIVPPTRTMPLSQYVQQLVRQQADLQTQLTDVGAKIDAIVSQLNPADTNATVGE